MRLRSLQTNEEPAGTASVKPVAASGGDAAKAGSQEPYEIVAPGDESSSERRNETPTQRSARERRYEELLRTAPPSPPASTAAKPAAPSAFRSRGHADRQRPGHHSPSSTARCADRVRIAIAAGVVLRLFLERLAGFAVEQHLRRWEKRRRKTMARPTSSRLS